MKKLLILSAACLFTLVSCNETEGNEEGKKNEGQKDTTAQSDSAVGNERPQPLLGETVQIMIGTKDYERTVLFYKTLGWEIEKKGEQPWRWTSLYDGSTTLLVNEDTTNYMGPAYHASNANEVYKKLADLGIKPAIEVPNEEEETWFNVYFSLDTVGYSIIADSGEKRETTTIADMMYNGGEKLSFPNPVSGILQEYAVSVEDLDKSMNYWEQLGFSGNGVNEGPPYKYTIFYDGALILGLHETKGMWYGQMLTYSGHGVEANEKAVELLVDAGFENAEPLEYGGQVFPGNYLIHDPAGNVFFLTTDFSKMKKVD